MSKDGYIILDDTITGKAGDEVPGVGHFYDHAEADTVWGQDLIYAFYADKTAYPLTFRLYEQQDDDDQDHDTRYDLAGEIVTKLGDEVGTRRDTYLFDSWFAHDSGLPEHIESYGNDWIGPLRSNRQVTYGGEKISVDALTERTDTVERHVDDETYHILTKKLPFSRLGDYEMQTDESASRHWHLLMAAYSLARLDPASSDPKHSLKEAVYNLLSWLQDNDDRGVDDLIKEIDHLFVHSTTDANVQN